MAISEYTFRQKFEFKCAIVVSFFSRSLRFYSAAGWLFYYTNKKDLRFITFITFIEFYY